MHPATFLLLLSGRSQPPIIQISSTVNFIGDGDLVSVRGGKTYNIAPTFAMDGNYGCAAGRHSYIISSYLVDGNANVLNGRKSVIGTTYTGNGNLPISDGKIMSSNLAVRNDGDFFSQSVLVTPITFSSNESYVIDGGLNLFGGKLTLSTQSFKLDGDFSGLGILTSALIPISANENFVIDGDLELIAGKIFASTAYFDVQCNYSMEALPPPFTKFVVYLTLKGINVTGV